MQTESASEQVYALGHSVREHDRLTLQDRLVGPATLRLLRDAGLRPGMRVLDIGCGTGHVTRQVAEIVGSAGAVVGIDRDVVALRQARERVRELGLAQVRFVQGDFRTVSVGGGFDAVVSRNVLFFQPDPAAALRTAVRALRSGGIVAVQEAALGEQVGAGPLSARALSWVRQAFARTGADPLAGLQLAGVFAAAGLSGVQLRADILAGDADASIDALVAESVAILLPVIERFGIATAAEVDVATLAERLRAETIERGCLAPCVYVGAWARVS